MRVPARGLDWLTACWLLSTSPSDAREGSEHGRLTTRSPEVQMEETRSGRQEDVGREAVGVRSGVAV